MNIVRSKGTTICLNINKENVFVISFSYVDILVIRTRAVNESGKGIKSLTVGNVKRGRFSVNGNWNGALGGL